MFAETVTLHFLGHTQLSGTYHLHLDVDGQVTEWWNFWEDQEALDDLLA